MVVFSSTPFPHIPKNTGITDETFQQSEKQDYFRHTPANMYKSSGSQFFRTTTEIQSGPDALDESRFVMTLLTSWEL